MAISKKGSRLIVVNGDRYRWRIRKKPTYSQGNVWNTLTVAVEKAENPGATLIIEMPQAHPCNWMGEKPVPVLPSNVENCIKRALELGWKPSEPGSTFELSY
ncbi:hypothetical protein NUACC21_80950 [Scytonema sp. NUACC21]